MSTDVALAEQERQLTEALVALGAQADLPPVDLQQVRADGRHLRRRRRTTRLCGAAVGVAALCAGVVTLTADHSAREVPAAIGPRAAGFSSPAVREVPVTITLYRLGAETCLTPHDPAFPTVQVCGPTADVGDHDVAQFAATVTADVTQPLPGQAPAGELVVGRVGRDAEHVVLTVAGTTVEVTPTPDDPPGAQAHYAVVVEALGPATATAQAADGSQVRPVATRQGSQGIPDPAGLMAMGVPITSGLQGYAGSAPVRLHGEELLRFWMPAPTQEELGVYVRDDADGQLTELYGFRAAAGTHVADMTRGTGITSASLAGQTFGLYVGDQPAVTDGRGRDVVTRPVPGHPGLQAFVVPGADDVTRGATLRLLGADGTQVALVTAG